MNILTILDKHGLSPKQLSSGEIRMRCPFRENHKDGSGAMSTFLNTEKNLWHCFSCGQKGTAIQLLTTKLGVSFEDAIELVELGSISDYYSPYDVKDIEIIDAAVYVPDEAISWSKHPKVFLDRKFPTSLLKKFRVGCYLNDDGVEVATIPLYQGDNLCGVKYRIDEAENRSFWYSKDFDRQRFIYNEPIGQKKIVLVEGETDVWKSVTSGILYAGATLGTELSMYQAKRLLKYERIFVAYDNDYAGLVATEKLYQKLGFFTSKLLFVPYYADDPGSCERKDWIYGIRHATDYAEYSMQMAIHMGDKYLEVKEKVAKMFKKK